MSGYLGTKAVLLSTTAATVTGSSTVGAGLTVDNNGATVLTVDRATSDGTIIDVQKSGTTVGSISSSSGKIAITLDPRSAATTGSGFLGGDGVIFPSDKTGVASDADVSLGGASTRFKDLYLSGGVYLGGTGSANKLDDVETGTWTVQERNGQATITTNRANYTKIGRLVYASASVTISSSNANPLNLTLPFTSIVNSFYAGNGSVGYHEFGSTYGDNLRPVIENGADNVMFYYGTGGSLVPCNGVNTKRIDFTVVYMT